MRVARREGVVVGQSHGGSWVWNDGCEGVLMPVSRRSSGIMCRKVRKYFASHSFADISIFRRLPYIIGGSPSISLAATIRLEYHDSS